ncbi:MAG: ABC transporter ATP-binding protein [Bacillota bacterium]
MPLLEAKDLSLGFGGKPVAEHVNLCVRPGEILTILGPNGSGKSTVLKALSRNLKPLGGVVYLAGRDLRKTDGRDIARQMAVLPQSPRAPGDITVQELVTCGRYPHQNWWRGSAPEDRKMVSWALQQTGLAEYAERPLTSLSGGERQRAWIALALAQNPHILLLDEPTTHLDISHQLEVLELLAEMNRRHGLTVVMVLHEVGQAAKYADRIVLLQQGRIVAAGPPREVISEETLRTVFGVEAEVWLDDVTNRPVLLVRGLAKKADAAGG